MAATCWTSCCLVELLVALNRAVAEAAAQPADCTCDRVVDQVVEYINEHYNEPLTLDDLSERFFISKYHLLRKFDRQVGTTVHRYILQKRLLIAKQLLGSGLAPSEVCQHCGFGDYANFYRAFRAEYRHHAPAVCPGPEGGPGRRVNTGTDGGSYCIYCNTRRGNFRLSRFSFSSFY